MRMVTPTRTYNLPVTETFAITIIYFDHSARDQHGLFRSNKALVSKADADHNHYYLECIYLHCFLSYSRDGQGHYEIAS